MENKKFSRPNVLVMWQTIFITPRETGQGFHSTAAPRPVILAWASKLLTRQARWSCVFHTNNSLEFSTEAMASVAPGLGLGALSKVSH